MVVVEEAEPHLLHSRANLVELVCDTLVVVERAPPFGRDGRDASVSLAEHVRGFEALKLEREKEVRSLVESRLSDLFPPWTGEGG